jgi:hypothetical protein
VTLGLAGVLGLLGAGVVLGAVATVVAILVFFCHPKHEGEDRYPDVYDHHDERPGDN